MKKQRPPRKRAQLRLTALAALALSTAVLLPHARAEARTEDPLGPEVKRHQTTPITVAGTLNPQPLPPVREPPPPPPPPPNKNKKHK